jgi:hypothetical protein
MAAFQFADESATQYFKSWIAELQQRPPSVATIHEIAPTHLAPAMVAQYQSGMPWASLIKDFSLKIIMAAGTPITLTRLQYLRSASGIEKGTRRIPGYKLKYAEAPPIKGPLPRTFMISGLSGVDHGPLRYLLAQFGFEEVVISSQSVHVGLFVLEQERARYDPRSAGVTCDLKSLLGTQTSCITNKAKLYENLRALDPDRTAKYTAFTVGLDQLKSMRPGQILILKPVGPQGGGGTGIEVVATPSDFNRARQTLIQKYRTGIASEYITDPLLFEGKKLHFRMYFMARSPIICPQCQSERPDCSVCYGRPAVPAHFDIFGIGKIITADLPYQNSNFKDPKIHDTHAKSTASNYYFPTDLGRCHGVDGTPVLDPEALGEDLLAQMRDILGVAAGIMVAQIKEWHYRESNFGYEVFGCDFMVRSSGTTRTVVLLEINDHIGMVASTGPTRMGPFLEGPGIYEWDLEPYRASPQYESLRSYTNFSRQFWEWVWEHAIMPVYAQFEPPEPIDAN